MEENQKKIEEQQRKMVSSRGCGIIELQMNWIFCAGRGKTKND